jgi:hypothetical protein
MMGAKKWLRRYLHLPLVPAHYTNVRYPDLGSIQRTLDRTGFATALSVAPNGLKRALIVQRAS